jgi:hypothetical protein
VFDIFLSYMLWLNEHLQQCNKRRQVKASGFVIGGSFQKFCTLYFFSLKMNLFYKVHLQAFDVISFVLYHGGPYGQVLYSCQDAFVVDASDYSGHLVNASEAFPMEWFLQFWEQVIWWAHVRTVWRVGKHLPSILSKISDTARKA